jgi:hypothetical protein
MGHLALTINTGIQQVRVTCIFFLASNSSFSDSFTPFLNVRYYFVSFSLASQLTPSIAFFSFHSVFFSNSTFLLVFFNTGFQNVFSFRNGLQIM